MALQLHVNRPSNNRQALEVVTTMSSIQVATWKHNLEDISLAEVIFITELLLVPRKPSLL